MLAPPSALARIRAFQPACAAALSRGRRAGCPPPLLPAPRLPPADCSGPGGPALVPLASPCPLSRPPQAHPPGWDAPAVQTAARPSGQAAVRGKGCGRLWGARAMPPATPHRRLSAEAAGVAQCSCPPRPNSNGPRPSLRGRHAKKRPARAAKRPGCSCDTVRQYEGVPPPAGRCGTGRRTCQKFSSCQISFLTATHLSSSRGCSLTTRAGRPGHEWSLRREQGTAIGGPWPQDSPRGPLFGSLRGTSWLAAARRHSCSRESKPCNVGPKSYLRNVAQRGANVSHY